MVASFSVLQHCAPNEESSKTCYDIANFGHCYHSKSFTHSKCTCACCFRYEFILFFRVRNSFFQIQGHWEWALWYPQTSKQQRLFWLFFFSSIKIACKILASSMASVYWTISHLQDKLRAHCIYCYLCFGCLCFKLTCGDNEHQIGHWGTASWRCSRGFEYETTPSRHWSSVQYNAPWFCTDVASPGWWHVCSSVQPEYERRHIGLLPLILKAIDVDLELAYIHRQTCNCSSSHPPACATSQVVQMLCSRKRSAGHTKPSFKKGKWATTCM